MKLAHIHVRTLALQALFLILLDVLQTQAADDGDHFRNAPTSIDLLPTTTTEEVSVAMTTYKKKSTIKTTTADDMYAAATDESTTLEATTPTSTIDDPSRFASTISPISTVIPLTPFNNTNATMIQYTNTSDPLVQYELECQAEESFCNKVSRAVGAAIDEFSRVVYVKNSLLIKVKYYSFCSKQCANNTYGWGAPTSQFTVPFGDGADSNYVYPQALAKQLAPYSKTSVWAPHDIDIELNHDLYMNGTDIEEAIKDGWSGTGTPPNGNFWFFNGSDTVNNTASNTSTSTITSISHAIQPHQVDFRYVVLHELLHGLGLLSSWAAYFYTDASPFHELVDGVIDPLELQLVTPGPYWYINQNTGPTYVTGFQPTMIFDKYLAIEDKELNVTRSSSLSNLAFDMQDFCVPKDDAFIVNFIRRFNTNNQSTVAHKLWLSMSQPETVSFQFQEPIVSNSSFILIPYLNKTYTSITLQTGGDLFTGSSTERTDSTLNRPGMIISHLDDRYQSTPDFLMTQQYHQGKTLEELVNVYYDLIPPIKYNTTTTSTNQTMIETLYRSPIGPGILRILDSIGYSTVLTKTNYTTDGSPKTPKSRSACDDNNANHAKPSPSATSHGIILSVHMLLIPLVSIITLFFLIHA